MSLWWKEIDVVEGFAYLLVDPTMILQLLLSLSDEDDSSSNPAQELYKVRQWSNVNWKCTVCYNADVYTKGSSSHKDNLLYNAGWNLKMFMRIP